MIECYVNKIIENHTYRFHISAIFINVIDVRRSGHPAMNGSLMCLSQRQAGLSSPGTKMGIQIRWPMLNFNPSLRRWKQEESMLLDGQESSPPW